MYHDDELIERAVKSFWRSTRDNPATYWQPTSGLCEVRKGRDGQTVVLSNGTYQARFRVSKTGRLFRLA
ncbi:hypothetical protein [Paraburkholderia sp. C35]|uniref:hypothetical protein n=1 Tax=Paraburkholderia sp. C35 TaxID=2126993 RepID=UPI000D69D4C0|nr:hypothetical protein [Paraburkholderia sp. C35]